MSAPGLLVEKLDGKAAMQATSSPVPARPIGTKVRTSRFQASPRPMSSRRLVSITPGRAVRRGPANERVGHDRVASTVARAQR